MTWGSMAARLVTVIQTPDEVFSVTYQMMEKPTTEDPKIERF